MKMPKKTFHFIVTLATSASLLVLLALVQNPTNFRPKAKQVDNSTNTINLKLGWNFISFTVDPNIDLLEFCHYFPTELDTSIYKIQSGTGYVGGSCKISNFDNYDIEPYVGYWIWSSKLYTFTMSGKKAVPVVNYQEGWNSYGLPIFSDKKTNISNYCTKYAHPNMKIYEIYRWVNSGWETHLCGEPINDFEVVENEGYLIRVELKDKPANKRAIPSLPER